MGKFQCSLICEPWYFLVRCCFIWSHFVSVSSSSTAVVVSVIGDMRYERNKRNLFSVCFHSQHGLHTPPSFAAVRVFTFWQRRWCLRIHIPQPQVYNWQNSGDPGLSRNVFLIDEFVELLRGGPIVAHNEQSPCVLPYLLLLIIVVAKIYGPRNIFAVWTQTNIQVDHKCWWWVLITRMGIWIGC